MSGEVAREYSGEGAQRIESGSVNIPAAPFPKTVAPKDGDNPETIAQKLIDDFNTALAGKDWNALSNLFLEEGYWRDHLVSTWDLHTLKGRADIKAFAEKNCSLNKVTISKNTDFQKPSFGPLDGVDAPTGITFLIGFESEVGVGQGSVRLANKGEGWAILTFYVTLQELKGYEEPLGNRRDRGVKHGGDSARRNWSDRRTDAFNFKDTEPVVLIVGKLTYWFNTSQAAD